MQTRFIVRNQEQVQAFLRSLPKGVLRPALKAMSNYFIGDDRHGLKHSDPYKYVTRKSAYGFTFHSDKQRRYVMAMIRSGEIKPGTPNRTGTSAAAWTARETNSGYGYTLENPTRGAYFTRSDRGQAAQPAKVGWRKVSKVIADNLKGALRAARAAIKKWIDENKPKG